MPSQSPPVAANVFVGVGVGVGVGEGVGVPVPVPVEGVVELLPPHADSGKQTVSSSKNLAFNFEEIIITCPNQIYVKVTELVFRFSLSVPARIVNLPGSTVSLPLPLRKPKASASSSN